MHDSSVSSIGFERPASRLKVPPTLSDDSAPSPGSWWLLGLIPRLPLAPERSPSCSEACRGPGGPPQAGPKVEDAPLSTARAGELDLDKANAWIGQLLQQKGADIFRMKGILAMAGAPQKFLFQGVHMIFTGEFVDDRWGDAPRINRLVFIGKHLDRAELTASFEACLVPPLATSRSVDWT